MRRRHVLVAGPALPWLLPTARAETPAETALRLLRAGGAVLAYRHALAPGTFDPPGFRLGDCATQRNLNDAGRAQARRTGEWLRAQGLSPTRVRSSPWCRCMDTARLAFGQAEAWAPLSSPRGIDPADYPGHLAQLRAAVRDARSRPGFEVWVTHNFVLADLAGSGGASGDGLVLTADDDGALRLAARLPAA